MSPRRPRPWALPTLTTLEIMDVTMRGMMAMRRSRRKSSANIPARGRIGSPTTFPAIAPRRNPAKIRRVRLSLPIQFLNTTRCSVPWLPHCRSKPAEGETPPATAPHPFGAHVPAAVTVGPRPHEVLEERGQVHCRETSPSATHYRDTDNTTAQPPGIRTACTSAPHRCSAMIAFAPRTPTRAPAATSLAKCVPAATRASPVNTATA